MMKERSGKVNQHTPGLATAIYTWWDEEVEPGVTKEDEHGGII